MTENNPMKNPETVKKVLLNKNYIESRKALILPIKNSKIEVKIQEFLKYLGLEFYTHQYINIEHGYNCDILIPIQEGINQKTIIECDGDFIHCNPKFYSEDFVRFPNYKKIITAKDIWERDEIRTKELIEKGYKVIRFWEYNINEMDINDFKERLLK